MSIDLNRLNQKLNNVIGVASFSALRDQINEASSSLASLTQTMMTLNKTGRVINGIRSVTEGLPEASESIAFLPSTAPVVELTNKMPGLEDKMNKTLSDDEKILVKQMSAEPWPDPNTGEIMTPKAQDTTKIVGTKKSNKLVGTPESIQSNINTITGELPNFDKIMKGIVPSHFEEFAKESLPKIAALQSLANGSGINLTNGIGLLNNIPANLKTFTNGLGGLGGGILNQDLVKSINSVTSSLENIAQIEKNLTALGILQNVKIAEENHLLAGINELCGEILSEDEKLIIVRHLKDEKHGEVINIIINAALLTNAKSKIAVPFTESDTGIINPGKVLDFYIDSVTNKETVVILNLPIEQIHSIAEYVIGIPMLTITDTITQLTVDLSTNVKNQSIFDIVVSSAEIIIGSTSTSWEGASTVLSTDRRSGLTSSDYTFSRVHNYEELVAEFNNVKRPITEMIIHWSEHFLDQAQAGAEEVHNKALVLGLDGCNYHYIIKKNGQIERGRPVDIEGEHANDHNKFSIGVTFIGGLNSYSTESRDKWIYGKESLTVSQYQALDMIVSAYYTIWPGCNVFGHNDLSEWAIDPGFDVSGYIKNRFKTTNSSNPTEVEVDQDTLVAKPVILSEAITFYNRPVAGKIVTPATFPVVQDQEQSFSTGKVAGSVPIAVNSFTEIINLINNDKLKDGDTLTLTDTIQNEILTIKINHSKVSEEIAKGNSVEVSRKLALEIKSSNGTVIDTETKFNNLIGGVLT